MNTSNNKIYRIYNIVCFVLMVSFTITGALTIIASELNGGSIKVTTNQYKEGKIELIICAICAPGWYRITKNYFKKTKDENARIPPSP